MHIWYIHHYGGGPGIGRFDRPYRLARAWRNQGHSATIFIAAYHHLLDKQETLEPRFDIDGIPYVALPARPYVGNGVSRILNMWDFTRNLQAAGRRYGAGASSPDAVIASSPHPFAIVPAQRLARHHGARLVFEIRDIWPLSITEILGTSRLHPFVLMCAAAERFGLGRADLISSVLPRADRYLVHRGYGNRPFVWVPNGMDVGREPLPLRSTTARETAAILARWEGEGCTTIVHAGALGKPNAVDLLLEAFSLGSARGEAQKCRVLVMGSGQELPSLQEFARSRNLDGVHFSGGVAKDEVVGLLKGCHIGYAGVRPLDALYQYGVSLNKLADYCDASLPVLLPIPPCGDAVSESGGGIARKADTPEALWAALREMLLLSSAERRALGAKGRAYMMREYDYERVAGRYAEAICQRLDAPAR